MAFQLEARLVADRNRAVLVEDDPCAIGGLNRAEILVNKASGVLGLDDRLLEGCRGNTTDVEGTHGELRAGLADRLGGNDADRFADLHRQAGGEVEAVAVCAASAIGFAGEHRADLELKHADTLDGFGLHFVDDIVDIEDDLAGDRILDLLAGNAAVDAGRKRSGFFVAVVNRGNIDAVGGAAILAGDDHILGDIDQLAGHVSRVGGLERGVGETLASAVGRDEVLEHRETFAEVRNDRTLDNFTRGLGHEAAHAAELFDLRLVAPCAGVDHHEERRRLCFAIVVLDLAIKRVGDRVGRAGPDVDDLLVALAVGDDTVAILLGNLLDFFVCLLDDLFLFFGNHHVDDTDRGAGAGCFLEAEDLELVESFDGLLLACDLIAAPDDLTNLLLADIVVDETNAGRPDLVEADAAGSGLDDFAFAQRGFERSELLAILVRKLFALVTKDRVLAVVGVANADPRMVFDLAGCNGEFHFG